MKEQNVQIILGEEKSKMEYYIDDFIEAEIEVKYFYKGNNSKRFVLGEVIGPNPLICFGVNPSTAKVINKQLEIDCTIKNIKKIVIKEKYDGWIMLNLYPEVSTKFSDLNNILMNRLHNINLYVIEKILSYFPKSPILACWGDLINKKTYLKYCLKGLEVGNNKNYSFLKFQKDIKGIFEIIKNRTCFHIGSLTEKGNPRHPLYTSFDDKLENFDINEYVKNL